MSSYHRSTPQFHALLKFHGVTSPCVYVGKSRPLKQNFIVNKKKINFPFLDTLRAKKEQLSKTMEKIGLD